ncbi:hypothetical protein R5R35_010361 [Gryllus longicercus]|uniref:Accessory gland protein n=1 Tax=Gryllus longicercus TaxID=2509291 RepID=A0AAN9WI93_9ORTH
MAVVKAVVILLIFMFIEQLMETGSQSISPLTARVMVEKSIFNLRTNVIHMGSNVSTMFDEVVALIDRLNSSIALYAT